MENTRCHMIGKPLTSQNSLILNNIKYYTKCSALLFHNEQLDNIEQSRKK